MEENKAITDEFCDSTRALLDGRGREECDLFDAHLACMVVNGHLNDDLITTESLTIHEPKVFISMTRSYCIL